MGHYFAEMVDQDERAKKNAEKEKRRLKNIKKAIEVQGLEWVLLQMLDDMTISGFLNKMSEENPYFPNEDTEDASN